MTSAVVPAPFFGGIAAVSVRETEPMIGATVVVTTSSGTDIAALIDAPGIAVLSGLPEGDFQSQAITTSWWWLQRTPWPWARTRSPWPWW
jgi:hypothetical protein